MAYSNSRSFNHARQPNAALETQTAADGFRNSRQAADRAIDEALRSVPLPDGLLTRLGSIVCAVSEDSADQVDWLGC
jgi:hypothetical protein